MNPKKILFNWSSGKDSAMALYILMQDPQYAVKALLTTITKDYDRISMHGVRTRLLVQQAKSLKIPLKKVIIKKDVSNKEYEIQMAKVLAQYKKAGITALAFGDIFLEDLRKYREDNLKKAGLKAIFPIWKRDTRVLADQFIGMGFKAIVTCVDTKVFDGKFAGCQFDPAFIQALPKSVDPCGENGEFHTFVYDGPIFHQPVRFKKGRRTLREKRFMFCDLI
jgi:uncharacterized protein (TIGR00290 family)